MCISNLFIYANKNHVSISTLSRMHLYINFEVLILLYTFFYYIM